MRAGKPGAGLPTGFAVPVLETGSPGPGKAGAPAAVGERVKPSEAGERPGWPPRGDMYVRCVSPFLARGVIQG